MKKILMSACLAGDNCRYDGDNNRIDDNELLSLLEHFEIVKACPEHEGGLDIPRPPAEIIGDRVINVEGNDVTKEYMAGAEIALKRAQEHECILCIMKESSPSCGVNMIYDGSFNGIKIPGAGCTSRMLKDAGFRVFSEKEKENIKELLKEEIK